MWQPPCHILYPHTLCGSPLAIFCIPTHFVGDALSGATLGLQFESFSYLSLKTYNNFIKDDLLKPKLIK